MFGLYLLWRTGEWALDKFVYENSTFAIQSIEVQTDGVIAPEQLRRWTNVKPGANLIALDLASVKRNLELVPMIDSVSVERVLPRTLKIRVTEREPMAQVNVPTAGGAGGIAVTVFQLDANGYVMQPLDPRLRVVPLSQMSAQLPVITGLNVFRTAAGTPRRVAAGAGGAGIDRGVRPLADGGPGGFAARGCLVAGRGRGDDGAGQRNHFRFGQFGATIGALAGDL